MPCEILKSSVGYSGIERFLYVNDRFHLVAIGSEDRAVIESLKKFEARIAHRHFSRAVIFGVRHYDDSSVKVDIRPREAKLFCFPKPGVKGKDKCGKMARAAILDRDAET